MKLPSISTISMRTNSSPRALALAGILIASTCFSNAASVTLTNNDVINTSSFTSGMGATNWDSGLLPAPGNDYFVAGNRTLRSPTNGLSAGAYTFAGDSLFLAGSFLVKGSNVMLLNNLVLSNGVVQNGDPGVTPKIIRIAGNVMVLTNGAFRPTDVDRRVLLTATLSGNGGLTFNDRGLVSLSGSHPYNGNVTLTGTTLDMDGTVSMTPSGLIVARDSSVVNGTNFYTTATNIVRAGGSLNVGYGPGGDLRVGWRTTSNTTNIPLGVLDVSVQPQFSANVGNFSIGYSQVAGSGTAGAAGLVYLATNNNIVATNLLMADTQEGTSPVTSRLLLGSGSNYLDTPVMTVGRRKQTAIVTLPFGGTLVLTNSLGERTDLAIADNAVATSANPTDTMDLTGGPVNLRLGTLTVGAKSLGGAGGTSGILTLATNAANLIDVNFINVGSSLGNASGTTAANGTINANGGAWRVNNDLTLGTWDGGFGAANGTLNLRDGTFAVAGEIYDGAGTSTLNLTGGVLDMQPSGDAVPGSITVDNLNLYTTISNAATIAVGRLQGTGAIRNQAGATSIAGTLSPGTDTTPGTLTLGSLSFLGGSSLVLNLTNNTTVGSGVNDLISVIGDMDLSSASISIRPLASTLATGVPYRIAEYTGEILGLPAAANLGRYTLTFTTDETSLPKKLYLTATGTPFSLRWGGELSSDWDLSITQNWTNRANNLPEFFYDADNVLFDDLSFNPSVQLETTVQPGSVTFTNDLVWFTVAGSGKISGSAGLTKSGTAPLWLNTTNDFTGPVLINGGMLIAGSDGALGATNSGTTIANGATLDVNDKRFSGELIHVQGAGSDSYSGAIVNSDTLNAQGARNATRFVVLDGPTTFGGSGRWDIRGSGATGSGFLQGGNFTLTKVGPNGVFLTDGAEASFGNLLINEGSFVIEAGSVINSSATVNVASTAALSFYRLNNPMGRPVVLQDGGILRSTDATSTGQNVVSGTVTLNGVSIVRVDGNVTNYLHLSGQVTGPGVLAKTGAQTAELLHGNNNWQGGTLISAGTLAIGNGTVNGSLPDAPLTNNGTLLYASSNPLTFNSPIEGPGTWSVPGAGQVTLTGQITGASRFNIYTSNGTMTVNGPIDTTAGMLKYGDGTLTLAASNSFSGSFAAGSGAPSPSGTSGGIIRLLHPFGFGGDPSIAKTVTVVRAELRLEGGMTIATNVYFQTSANSTAGGAGAGLVAIRNMAGTNTVPNVVEFFGGAGASEFRSDAGLLVFNGPMYLGYNSSRSAIFSGAGTGVINGPISDDATNDLTFEKTGTGTWTVTAANTYTGPTLVRGGTLLVNGSIGGTVVTVQNNGTLGGTGSIGAPVTVNLGGTLAPGTSVGTLTLTGDLTNNGSILMEVGRNGSVLTNDLLAVTGTVGLGGTLVITNVGSSALVPGDSFQVITAGVYAGGFTNIVYPAGYNWTNSLALDGRVGVASVASGEPPTLGYVVANNQLTFTWTGGFKLQAQTNTLGIGLSNNWVDYPGGGSSPVVVPVSALQGSVFFRLVNVP